MWPIQFAFRLRISCKIFLCFLTLSNTSSFLTWSVQLILSILFQHHISKLSRCFWSTVRSVQVSTPHKAMLQIYKIYPWNLWKKCTAFIVVSQWYTALLKIIVVVLTTCHTKCSWDRSICIFLFNRTTLQVFVTYLTGAIYVHPLWFYKHQHDNRVHSKLFVACQRWWFQWRFAAILVNCAPSGEMHIYCTPHIIKENFENFLIHQCSYILLPQV